MDTIESEYKLFEQIEVEQYLLKESGNFPNNHNLPLLVYRKAITLSKEDYASKYEETFMDNSWGGTWIDGVHSYHHYHSRAHEVLGIYKGNATIQFGGPEGVIVKVTSGDIVIIPAGVAHKSVESSIDFSCVGAYPKGQQFDMNYGKEGERPGTDINISRVGLPELDPVFGESGPLLKMWS